MYFEGAFGCGSGVVWCGAVVLEFSEGLVVVVVFVGEGGCGGAEFVRCSYNSNK